MKILITGAAGFVGSHAAEFYAKKNHQIIALDNLSRDKLLKKEIKNKHFNWDYLKRFKNLKLIEGDIRNIDLLKKLTKNCDAVIHAAAQTAVTTSIIEPETDFSSNVIGTFNILESARLNNVKKVVYCSTNKVFGENVNKIGIKEEEKRYNFEEKYKEGIPEDFSIDLCEHTPYGCSKLTGDIYCQDYAHLYGISTGVFRMSCIYGTRQFGVEDQGWVAWFTIATILNKPITIFGDGKQVRDVLYIQDLVELYDKFLNSNITHQVLNVGGGPKFTLSLLELLDLLEELTGRKPKINYSSWRQSDQKVYISDIRKAKKILNWTPKTPPREGVKNLVNFIKANKEIF